MLVAIAIVLPNVFAIQVWKALGKRIYLFAWAKFTMQILSEKILMRKGKKTSWSHIWNMLTVNANDTVRAESFYCHTLLLGHKQPPLARRVPLLGKDHQTGTVKGGWEHTSQRGPETEPCCSKQKGGGWCLCGAELLPAIIPVDCR